MNAFPADSSWLAALLASANQPPRRPRVPLVWQQHVIGSVEPGYLHPIAHPASSIGPALLRQELSPAGPRWRLGGDDASHTLQQVAQALLGARVGCVAQHWRDEQLAVCDAQGQQVATVERGVVRPLGIATRARRGGATEPGRRGGAVCAVDARRTVGAPAPASLYPGGRADSGGGAGALRG